ncbi:MAG TPA: phospholipase D family protein [Pilimelia sp.]|nr:phospholipase D family protein [Pilimelia sp.]
MRPSSTTPAPTTPPSGAPAPATPPSATPAFALRLQDAGAHEATLLETLVTLAGEATGGGAFFAWTNSSGARALLADKSFQRFIRNGRFRLVVGLDSITDEAAVATLAAFERALPHLSVHAFLHQERGLFHPKLAWFETAAGLALVVGSGNLTMGGLGGNWEAYAVVTLAGAEATAVRDQLEQWLTAWSECLLPVDDPRVVDRARQNTGSERSLRRPPQGGRDGTEAARPELAALVAEIPLQRGRPGQANVNKGNYEDFFGARVGSKRRIVLYHVADDGTLGEVESRPSVEVRSHNYRFELAAMKGVSYSSDARLIGVFMRLAEGSFLYTLLLPGDPHYPPVDGFLAARWRGPARQVRRVRTTVAELRAAWPDSPLWAAPLPAL